MTRRLIQVVMLLVLLSAGWNLAQQVRALATGAEPDRDPPAGASWNELLRLSDAALPAQATVLLVTPGRDARHDEYTLFHRALYLLIPRAVWWVTPAAADGSWESRWWLNAPIDHASLAAVAREKHATHLLVAGGETSQAPGEVVLATDAGALFRLGVEESPAGRAGPREMAGTWPLATAVALLIPWLLGFTAVRLMASESGAVESAGLAWLIGTGITSLAMLCLNAAGLGLPLQLIVISAVVVVAALWWRPGGRGAPAAANDAAGSMRGSARPDRRAVTKSRLNRGTGAVAAALILLQIIVIANRAIGQPLHGWDGWVSWGMKARAIFLAGGIGPTVYLDPTRAVTHLDYPLLLPLTEAWLFGWLGTADDRAVGVLSLLFYLALLAVAYGALRRWSVPRVGALVALSGIATLVPLASAASDGYADVLLGALAMVTAVYLGEWLAGAPRATLLMAVLTGGLMPWAKREGGLLLIALCVAALICTRGARRARQGACALTAGGLLLAGPWYAFVALNGVGNTDFMPPGAQPLPELLWRLPSIAWHEALIGVEPVWNFAWILTGIMLLRRARKMGAQRFALSPTCALIYIGLFSAAYLYSAYTPFQQHVLTSAYRLLAQVAPLCILWLAHGTLAPDA